MRGSDSPRRNESATPPAPADRRRFQLATVAHPGLGHVAATLYSLVGTCKLNRIEPYAYLKDVLQRLPSHPVSRLAELLPFNWKPATT
jgi:hypothetical protein